MALKLTTARWFTPSGRTIQREAESEEEQLLQVVGEARDTGSTTLDPAASDSALKSRPIFRTDGGRIVRGGGGIVPDIVVRGDTLTTAEQAFRRALGSGVSVYRDVLNNYALQVKEKRTVTSEAFQVTPGMRQEVYDELNACLLYTSPSPRD